ncbi:HAD family hydrolase [Paenibacillus sp. OAS669]|uniref:HAD family hydrolase n=1 Tax=Paenibacillus sp. OAS669 TaxID=2663821 RepID=UPI00178A44F4|nr:HAD family hydrolase [Paenibacillus sp. OAS669]MBE1442467.1 putative hydrolase of the HAD superfamily [Paenibacillus sp. OAS669]
MIFFDLDGTLLDFKAAEFMGVRGFHQQFGERLKLQDVPCESFYEEWCRVAVKHYSRYLKGELTFGQQQAERMKELVKGEISDKEASAFFDTYIYHFEQHWKPYDDVLPCLQKLSGYRLGVITNGDSCQQRMKLERMGLKDYFDVVVASGDIGVSKPDAAIFTYACQCAGEDVMKATYVGDDVRTDIVPCEKLGIYGIWLNRKNESPVVPVQREIRSLDALFDYLPC